MQAIFKLKTRISYDSNAFDNMSSKAVELLRGVKPFKYTQAIVLLSALGKEYSTVIQNACSEEKEEEKALLKRLKASEDTEINYVLCLWYGNDMDITSYDFRKMLSLLNCKNSEALLFVMSTEGVSAIRLSETMK